MNTFHTYAQVEDAMAVVVENAFFERPFFRDLMAGSWSLGFLRYFAVQYGHYSAHFPRVLGAAIAAMAPLDAWWIPLADNLWDEAGRGIPGRSHAILYRTFLVSVAPDIPADFLTAPAWQMGNAVNRAIQTFLQFFRQATPLEAMAAVGLGSEFFAGRVMGTIGQGLRHPAYQRHGPIDTRFWDSHANTHEPRHYALCRDILLAYSHPADLTRMFEVGRTIAESEAAMYDGLYREGRTL